MVRWAGAWPFPPFSACSLRLWIPHAVLFPLLLGEAEVSMRWGTRGGWQGSTRAQTDTASLGQKLRRVPVVCSCNKQLGNRTVFFLLIFYVFSSLLAKPLQYNLIRFTVTSFRAVNTTTPRGYINHISLASSFVTISSSRSRIRIALWWWVVVKQ